jgi:phage terminase large subunit GpA-like protein
VTLASLAAETVRHAFAPRTKLTGSQWANRYGWIAKSSGAAEPGQYSTERAPYLAEMLDVMCDEDHSDVTINKPAQVGYTEALLQVCAYGIKEDPSGIIVIRTSKEDAQDWMKERVDTMLAESPHLNGVIRSEGGRRTSDDTMSRKVVLGGWLVAVGANSPTGLRSRPARRLIGDERSGWKLDARQEGDPWDLGVERTTTFWNAKRIRGSTPGELGVCPITKEMPLSDWREYHVPCPACGFKEPFRWKTESDDYRLVCEKDPANQIIPQTARYLCTACGTLIPESEKAWMLRPSSGAAWIPRHPGRELVGFDLNGIISPWQPWATIMKKWLEAQQSLEKLKVFVTHTLAEPWKNVAGERIDATELARKAAAEKVQQLPEWVGACVGFVDIQKDRVETLVIGVGAGEEIIVWDWDTAEGDPSQRSTFDEARELLMAGHGDVPLFGVGIDTGYLTDEAWGAVDRWNQLGGLGRVIGTKGEDGRGRPWIQKPGKVTSRRVRRPWLLGVDTAKDALQLRLKTESGPGAIHYAETLSPVFFEHLASEERKLVPSKGRLAPAWRPIDKAMANEGLDLLIGALGVMYSFGPQWIAQLGAMAARRAAGRQQQPAPTEPEEAPDPLEDAVNRMESRRPKSNYVQGWRR